LSFSDTILSSLWSKRGQIPKQFIIPLLNSNRETVYQIGRLVSFVTVYKTHSDWTNSCQSSLLSAGGLKFANAYAHVQAFASLSHEDQ